MKKRRGENLSSATCLSSAERILLTAFGVPKNVEPIFMIDLICLAHHPRPPPPPIGGGASTHFMKCRKYRTPIEWGTTTTLFSPFVAYITSILLFNLLRALSLTCVISQLNYGKPKEVMNVIYLIASRRRECFGSHTSVFWNAILQSYAAMCKFFPS